MLKYCVYLGYIHLYQHLSLYCRYLWNASQCSEKVHEALQRFPSEKDVYLLYLEKMIIQKYVVDGEIEKAKGIAENSKYCGVIETESWVD